MSLLWFGRCQRCHKWMWSFGTPYEYCVDCDDELVEDDLFGRF